MENARRKAYTARSFPMSTAEYARQFAGNDPVVLQQVTLPHVIAIPGGLPVKLGDDVIGGVGLSGSRLTSSGATTALRFTVGLGLASPSAGLGPRSRR
jgi:uncharacterized protein GlcG (DUF336 family)